MESYLSHQKWENDAITELEITPLVSVALVMVIVFMVTAPLFMQPLMDIKLPTAIAGEDHERENVTISITESGTWVINEQTVRADHVQPLLTEKIKKTRDKYVIVRADKEATHEWLTYAIGISKKCGAKTVSIAVKRKPG